MELASDPVGQMFGQQFVQDHPQGVHITTDIDLEWVGQHLLGTHVGERSHKLTDVCLARRIRIAVRHARHAEIQNLGLSALIYQDVARFQIPVDDAALVRMVHRVADLDHQLQPVTRVRAMRCNIGVQRIAPDELHRKIGLRPGPAVGGCGLIDLGNPRMLQSAERQRFQLEPTKELRADPASFDNLERHRTSRVLLFCLVDGSHPAFAEDSNDAVAPHRRRVPTRVSSAEP